jgi:hypothetical protein
MVAAAAMATDGGKLGMEEGGSDEMWGLWAAFGFERDARDTCYDSRTRRDKRSENMTVRCPTSRPGQPQNFGTRPQRLFFYLVQDMYPQGICIVSLQEKRNVSIKLILDFCLCLIIGLIQNISLNR